MPALTRARRACRQAGAGIKRRLERIPATVKVVRDRPITPAEVASLPGVRHQVMRPAETPVRREPRRFGVREGDLSSGYREIPEVDVLWLPGAFVIGRFGMTLVPDGRYIPAVNGFPAEPHRLPEQHRGGRVRQIRGTLASVASPHASGNYAHFLLDCLPRVALLEQAGVDLGAVDHLLVSSPGPHGDRLLQELGLDPARWIRAKQGVAIRADMSIVTTMPHRPTSYRPWEVAFLRERLGRPPVRTGRRIWVPRRTHRRIVNEAELLGVLEEHGFETFDPGPTSEDPRQVFAGAAVVVGGHGAGLGDLAFCQPGTQVLELLPDSHVRAYFWTLSDAAGLEYSYLIGPAEPAAEGANAARLDYRVDVAEFRTAIETILG